MGVRVGWLLVAGVALLGRWRRTADAGRSQLPLSQLGTVFRNLQQVQC